MLAQSAFTMSRRLAGDNLHIRISATKIPSVLTSRANLFDLSVRELDMHRGHVLIERLYPPRAGNRNYALPLRHQPSKRHLSYSALLLVRHSLDLIHDCKTLRKILFREARQFCTPVIFDVFRRCDLAGEETATKRAVGNDGNAKFLAGIEKVDLGAFNVKRERGVLDLYRGDWVDGVSSAESVR